MHRQRPRHYEVIDRLHAQRAEGIDLFGHFHRPDLRGDRRAHAPGDHQAREHRTEFAEHRHRHDRADGGIHSEAVKLEIRLRGEDRTREAAGDRHHELRAEAHFHHLPEKEPPADRRHDHRHHGVVSQKREFAEILEEIQGGTPERAKHASAEPRCLWWSCLPVQAAHVEAAPDPVSWDLSAGAGNNPLRSDFGGF